MNYATIKPVDIANGTGREGVAVCERLQAPLQGVFQCPGLGF